MERMYKIAMPKPCSKNWDEMTPKENGRFCLSCSKSVIDFTTMLPDEVQHFFIQNQNKNICGRFRKSQLDTITIHISSRVLLTQTQYHKMFLLALFIAMGTTLFSCKDKNGNKQKIDKVEVVSKLELDTNRIMIGKSKFDPNDSLHNNIPPPPPPKTTQVKFIKTNKSKIKANSTTTICDSVSTKVQEEEIIYMGAAIYTDPEFKGGIKKFKDYIQKNYVFPKKTKEINGEILATFVIGKDGGLSDIKLIKDIGDGMGKELIRLLEKSENWIPGSQNGKMVRNLFSITLFIKTNTLKKSFFTNKFNHRIDSIIVTQ